MYGKVCLDILSVTSVTELRDGCRKWCPSVNDSISYLYPRLVSLRSDLITYKNYLVEVRFNEKLTDSEVENISNSLSEKSFMSLIEERLEDFLCQK